jgi:hypothetical protein
VSIIGFKRLFQVASFREHKGQIAHRWTNQAIRTNATAEKWGEVGNRKAIRSGMMLEDGPNQRHEINPQWLAIPSVGGWLGSAIGEDV